MLRDIFFLSAQVAFVQAMPLKLVIMMIVADVLVLIVKLCGWWR